MMKWSGGNGEMVEMVLVLQNMKPMISKGKVMLRAKMLTM